MEYKWKRADIGKVINLSLRELEPLIQGKNVLIDMDNSADMTDAVLDQQRMTQVIINILSNAIKLSERGQQIRISLSDDRLPNGAPALRCCIADEGPGIPETELDAVFDKFIQSSKTKTGAGGTGLGLAICREIIGAHGGKIWAENVYPKGAVFTFVIPRTRAPETPSALLSDVNVL